MIRRDFIAPGHLDRWVLFSQPDHAVFGGDIAKAWSSPAFAPLVPEVEVLAAINRHDDGWRTWEEHPQVDRDTGRPIAFNEMPLEDSLRIWQTSIEAGRSQGPLVAYAIAGHFARLLNQFDSWRGNSRLRPQAEHFLTGTNASMADWLAKWRAEFPDSSPGHARRVVEFVRLFDALSLWFLCSHRTGPGQFDTPNGPTVTFTPIAPWSVCVEPWPFTADRLIVSAVGRAVPARVYQSSEDLHNTPAETVPFFWSLVPNPAGI